MRFAIGTPPKNSDFEPNQEEWQKIRELRPGALLLIGGLMGIPIALLVSYGWSQIYGMDLSFVFYPDTFGKWPKFVMPLTLLLATVIFLASLFFIHELIHALAYPRFGFNSDTIIGIWPSRFLAYAIYSGQISIVRFIIVLIAPFVILSVAPLLLTFAGGPHWPTLKMISVANALLCGGDAVICVMIINQVPLNATLRNSGWDTWWRNNTEAEQEGGGSRDNRKD